MRWEPIRNINGYTPWPLCNEIGILAEYKLQQFKFGEIGAGVTACGE